jgi:hypothetical protein
MSTLLDEASLIVTPNGYKAGKLYSVVPSNGDGDFTVTRATTATRVNSAGLVESVASNVPRLDYSLGSCPNILLEPQRTNLVLNSNNLNSWNVVGSALQLNSTTSPSGNTDASKIVPTTSNGYIASTISTIASATYVFSVYVKSATGSNVNSNIHAVNASITTNFTATNDWQRISIVFTSTSTSTPVYIGGFSSLSTGEDLFIWGAQLEAGANPTSYIPTTTASVTRNSDVISRGDIFTNGLITSSGGTFFIELKNNVPLTRDTTTRLGIGDDTALGTNSLFLLGGSPQRMVIQKRIAGINTTLYLTTTNTCKIAIKWNGASADVFENGVKVVAATAFTPTDMEYLRSNGLGVNAYINAMALWPTPLTDTQCIALTTL